MPTYSEWRVLNLRKPPGPPVGEWNGIHLEGRRLADSLAGLRRDPPPGTPEGVAIHWTCCHKRVGSMVLDRRADGELSVLVVLRAGRSTTERPDLESVEKVRFTCPTCGRNPVLNGARALDMLTAVVAAAPKTGTAHVTFPLSLVDEDPTRRQTTSHT